MQNIFKKIAKYFILSTYLILFINTNIAFVFADGTVNVDSVVTADTKATFTLTASGGSTAISIIIDYGTNQTTFSDNTGTITIPANSSSPHEITGLIADTTYYFEVRDATTATTIYMDGIFHTQAVGSGYDLSTGASATPECTAGPDGYCLLAPIGGLSVIHTAELPDYFNTVYKIGIGIAAVLAIIMLVFGGVQYMSTDALSGKSEGKSKMTRAIFGLILALGSFVILNTVNPKLLNFTFNIDQATISVNPDEIETSIPPPMTSDGKYCINQNGGQGYSNGSFWDQNLAADSALRQQLSGANSISVGGGGCETVGQQSCTSLAGLVTAGILKVRDRCPTCELTITGGTECWLHSAKTAHGKNSPIVDLRNTGTPILKAYIEARGNLKGTITGWGQLYVVDGIEFINEGDHYHIWGYSGEHASKYPH